MLHLQDLLAAKKGSEAKGSEKPGGLLFLEVEAAAQIRERHGLAALEHVLADVGRLLANTLSADGHAARLGDASFLVVDDDGSRARLEAAASTLGAARMQRAEERRVGKEGGSTGRLGGAR